MSRLVAMTRIFALVTMTLGISAVYALTRLWVGQDSADSGRLADTFVGAWARSTRRICGIKVIVDGEIPTTPVAVVANHMSYVDIVAIWCAMPGVFVAREDVSRWPLIGQVGQLVGTIFLDRTRKRDLLRVIPEMEGVLASGRNVIFFPEGTSSRGQEVLPYKSPLFASAVRQEVPVVAVSLQFETDPSDPPADWSVCWWGDMTFAPHIFALLQLSQFRATLRFSKPIPPETDRKELCRMAQDSVQNIFHPTYTGEPNSHEMRAHAASSAPAQKRLEQI